MGRDDAWKNNEKRKQAQLNREAADALKTLWRDLGFEEKYGERGPEEMVSKIKIDAMALMRKIMSKE